LGTEDVRSVITGGMAGVGATSALYSVGWIVTATASGEPNYRICRDVRAGEGQNSTSRDAAAVATGPAAEPHDQRLLTGREHRSVNPSPQIREGRWEW
jgi:hypothetical protein